jgi:hypothetical protein
MAESHHRLAVVLLLISATRSPVENVYETASYSSSSSRKQSIWDITNRWQGLRLPLLPRRRWSTIMSPSVLLCLFRRLLNIPTELPIPRTTSRALSLPLVLPIGVDRRPPPQARVAGALRWRPNPCTACRWFASSRRISGANLCFSGCPSLPIRCSSSSHRPRCTSSSQPGLGSGRHLCQAHLRNMLNFLTSMNCTSQFFGTSMN